MNHLTVKQLRDACDKVIAEGFGDHKILISMDDEGNGFHELHYAFITDKEEIDEVFDYADDWDYPIVLLG